MYNCYQVSERNYNTSICLIPSFWPGCSSPSQSASPLPPASSRHARWPFPPSILQHTTTLETVGVLQQTTEEFRVYTAGDSQRATAANSGKAGTSVESGWMFFTQIIYQL